MFSRDQIISKIDSSPKSSGVDCDFVALDDKVGIKIYACEKTRDMSFDRQRRLSKYALAPLAYKKLDFDFSVGGGKFAYLTEKVDIAAYWPYEHGQSDDEELVISDGGTHYEYWEEWWNTYKYDLMPIVEKIDDLIGWEFNDYHPGNWGIKNGKFIPIDFGS